MKITFAIPTSCSPPAGTTSLVWAGIVLLATMPCQGQGDLGAGPPTVGPEEAVELFRQHGPELRAARADFRAVAGRASQDAAYPNPVFSVLREDLGRAGDDYWENSFAIEQTVEWPGRTLARKRAADRATSAARSAFRADSLRLLLEVRRSYLGAARAEARVLVLEEVVAVVREAVADGEARREEGDISGYELRRLELELARLEQSLAAAVVERDAARRELAARILPGSDTVSLATRGLPEGRPPPVDREHALAAATRRPGVVAMRRAVESADAEASATRLQRIPDLRLTGGYKTQSDDFDGAVLGVSLSLPLFDRKGGSVRAVEARAEAAASRLDLRRREARSEVLRALDRYRSVRRRSRGAGERLKAPSREILRIARTAYAAGEMVLGELLDGADAYLEARSMALELRTELWLAYHELGRAMGGHGAGSGADGREDGSRREGEGR